MILFGIALLVGIACAISADLRDDPESAVGAGLILFFLVVVAGHCLGL